MKIVEDKAVTVDAKDWQLLCDLVRGARDLVETPPLDAMEVWGATRELASRLDRLRIRASDQVQEFLR